MRISDWSSDVCSSDLRSPTALAAASGRSPHHPRRAECALRSVARRTAPWTYGNPWKAQKRCHCPRAGPECHPCKYLVLLPVVRSEEHTSELQSLMRISYAVFCLNKTHQLREATMLAPPNISES